MNDGSTPFPWPPPEPEPDLTPEQERAVWEREPISETGRIASRWSLDDDDAEYTTPRLILWHDCHPATAHRLVDLYLHACDEPEEAHERQWWSSIDVAYPVIRNRHATGASQWRCGPYAAANLALLASVLRGAGFAPSNVEVLP